MRGEPEGVTIRPTLFTAPKVMYHPVKGIELILKIEQVVAFEAVDDQHLRLVMAIGCE